MRPPPEPHRTQPPRRPAHRLGRFVLRLGLAALLLGLTAPAAAPDLESKLKGVFLLNFAKLVEWPASAFTDASSPVRIGILGDDPLGPVLEELLRGETARGRPVEMRRGTLAAELTGCHVVFLTEKRTAALRSQLAALAAHPILTVGDDDAFLSAGGMIQFVREGKNLRFQINPEVATAAGLKISARILALGKVSANTPAPKP